MKAISHSEILSSFPQHSAIVVDSQPWNLQALDRVIESARWYASGDNCQPFRFGFCPEGIEIVYILEPTQHFLNSNEIATFVSLGLFLEAVEASGIANGWIFEGGLKLEQIYQGGSLGVLKARKTKPRPEAILPILARRTSRLPYLPDRRFTSLSEYQEIQRAASGSVRVHLCERPSNETLKKIALCDDVLTDRRNMKDLLRYTRFSGNTSTGFMPENLGLAAHEKFAFKFAKLLGEDLGPFAFSWPANHAAIAKSLRNLKSSPYLMLLSGPAPSKESDWVELGRNASKAWGQVGVAGFCAQPLSPASLAIRTFEAAGQMLKLKPALQKVMRTADQEVRRLFRIPENEVPLWLFRVGSDGRVEDPYRLRLSSRELMITSE